MKTATLVKQLPGFTGSAHLYRLSEPLTHDNGQSFDHVIVSATVASFSGPVTYIFGADESGKVLDWGELDGSFRGDLDHAQALRNAGYEVIGS